MLCALEVGRLLEAEGIDNFEEPCPCWKREAIRQFADALKLDVTGGAQDWNLAIRPRMINVRAVDIVQTGVICMGGLPKTAHVTRMAEVA